MLSRPEQVKFSFLESAFKNKMEITEYRDRVRIQKSTDYRVRIQSESTELECRVKSQNTEREHTVRVQSRVKSQSKD